MRRDLERACSIPMNLVDTEDCSYPSSFRIGLTEARRKNQLFGAYEEALSVSIRYLRLRVNNILLIPSLPSSSPPSLIATS
nr:unnamed protein product [Spirometra erinaceieuropaei]